MAQITANELKKKDSILLGGQPYTILDVRFNSPSARGASTMAQVRVRNLLTGAVLDKNFKTNEKFDEADVEKVPVVFLYQEGELYHFMDNSSFEQFHFSSEKLANDRYYLKENMELGAIKHNGRVVLLELPAVVELTVTETSPPIKGASASGRSGKKAILETGLEVLVPLYLEAGTIVRVNTETNEVSGRVTE